MTAEQRAAFARVFFWVVVVVLLYVTTVPFGLETPANFGRKWLRTEILPFYLRKGEIYHPSDLLGNLLLFLPFGFALQGLRLERRGRLAASVWPAIFGGMLMSLAIESMQFFLKERFSSSNDWVMNVAGTAVGAALAQRYFKPARDHCLRFGRKLLQRPGVLVLVLSLFAYALWMLLPFNFTLSVNNLLRKWLQWKFSAAYLTSLPHEILTLDRREYWSLVVLENLLFGLLLGGQFILCCHWYRPNNRRFFRYAIALLVLILLLITFLQFVVMGSNPDILPLVAVAWGLVTGLILMRGRTASTAQISPWPLRASRAQALLLLPLFLLFLLLLLRPDLPDLRVAQSQSLQNNAASPSLAVLFASLLDSVRPSLLRLGGSAYFRLFLKIMLITMPVVFALAQMGLQRCDLVRKHHELAAAILGVVVGLLAQALRFFLWHSSVSLLTVLALILGGMIGLWLEAWWAKFKSAVQQDHSPLPTLLEQRGRSLGTTP
ncbi:MAG: VanZ family protein [bacterium]